MVSSPDEPMSRPRWYQHPFNRPAFYRVAAGLAWLPRRVRLAVARGLGRLAPHLMPRERAAVRKTLGLSTGATGRDLDELTTGVFTDFAMCFSDLVSSNRQSEARLRALVSTAPGAEYFTGMTGGVISLTAHVGNWELAGRLLAGHAHRPTHVVVAEEEVRDIERWVRRDGLGVRFVTRNHPTISVELIAALRRGEIVAVQGDRALGTRGDASIPFFGHPAPFPLGPFVLARAVGVPLVPAFCLLEPDHRYAVTVGKPLTVARDGEEDAARAWVAVLEAVVREHPTQWFNFFDIWNPFVA
ncbi:MAG: hypothetical protein AUG01_01715 [Candidatus Rokubacteria bacterium 13_1_20CM_2_69_58]|nr:MAG: hypothetical protein AUG01_01715 [Candidatus Rokubacteria bacterium 13_1_20CM_2_69_58]